MKVLVPISGGKDSQASLKLALQTYAAADVRGLFCDTGFEHPLTYAHIETMRQLYGVRIDTVCGGDVLEKSVKHGRFPGGGARHCTDELKIRETRIYCKTHAAELQHGFEVWYGMRSDESAQRTARYAGKVCDELYAPHDVLPKKYPKYLAKMGVMFRLCILHWTEAEVKAFVTPADLNPLYAAGFSRVGCFPCLAAGDIYKEKAFQFDDFGRQQYQKVIAISAVIGKSVWTSKGGKERNETACSFCNE